MPSCLELRRVDFRSFWLGPRRQGELMHPSFKQSCLRSSQTLFCCIQLEKFERRNQFRVRKMSKFLHLLHSENKMERGIQFRLSLFRCIQLIKQNAEISLGSKKKRFFPTLCVSSPLPNCATCTGCCGSDTTEVRAPAAAAAAGDGPLARGRGCCGSWMTCKWGGRS